MQSVSHYENLRSNTVQHLKDFDSQLLLRQAKMVE